MTFPLPYQTVGEFSQDSKLRTFLRFRPHNKDTPCCLQFNELIHETQISKMFVCVRLYFLKSLQLPEFYMTREVRLVGIDRSDLQILGKIVQVVLFLGLEQDVVLGFENVETVVDKAALDL